MALAALAVAAAGCARKSDSGSGAAAPLPEAPRSWPQGVSAPLKVTDELTLAIPLQYERSAISHEKAARALISVQSDRSEVQFDFFLPDFSGYTLQNYRNEFDENKVEVVYLHAGDPHEAEPDAPGEYPPNMLKRSLRDFLNPDDYRDMYGLRCYQGRIRSERLACYGRRDGGGEDIMLYTLVPPYPPEVTFPQMQARYFSARYGGVRIAWRTHAKNLPRWQDIDAQIWKFIDAWSVAPASPSDEPATMPPGAPSPVQPAAPAAMPNAAPAPGGAPSATPGAQPPKPAAAPRAGQAGGNRGQSAGRICPVSSWSVSAAAPATRKLVVVTTTTSCSAGNTHTLLPPAPNMAKALNSRPCAR
jgi:hypothetical protein